MPTMTDAQRRCHRCGRTDTVTTHEQAYIGPVVQRVEQCADENACAEAQDAREQATR